jgi:membrane fusion protein, multidrug efflux system
VSSEPTPPSEKPAEKPGEPREKPRVIGADGEPAKRRKGGIGRKVGIAAVALAILAGAAFGIKEIVFYKHHAETDDAYVEQHIDPVLPRVSGFVSEVLVDDNQKVEKGQLLLKIDSRDLQAKVDAARAALENARAKIAVARANVTQASAESGKSAADLERYAALRRKEEISQQQYDAAATAARTGSAAVAAEKKSVTAAEAEAAQKKGDLDFAQLQVSYAEVLAPSTGLVSKKSVEVGQYVQAGQPLLAIVEDRDVWVVANFKETQLKKMRVGQEVEMTVDAYPKTVFRGRVESFAAATGAKFALLPPDNATGNFTKVVQRVPVKIVLADRADPEHPLRAGMSVNAIVKLD